MSGDLFASIIAVIKLAEVSMKWSLIMALTLTISCPSFAAVKTYSLSPGKILLSEDSEYGGCLVEPKVSLDTLN